MVSPKKGHNPWPGVCSALVRRVTQGMHRMHGFSFAERCLQFPLHSARIAGCDSSATLFLLKE